MSFCAFCFPDLSWVFSLLAYKMENEPVTYTYSYKMNQKDIQVSRLYPDGFLLVKGDLEKWIQSNHDHLSVHTLEWQINEKIGKSIGRLLHLTELYIWNGKGLPNSISSLRRLQSLEIYSCHQLQELPANFGDLNSLTFLCLNNCSRIVSLPDSISKLSKLTSLHFGSCNLLKEFPANSSVVILSLWLCESIQSLPKGLCNLKDLFLTDCPSLSKLPKDLNTLQGLIIESCCSIKSLPKCLTSLKNLDLPLCSKGRLANLMYFERLCHVTFYTCPECGAHLEELPENLGELSQLSTLNIEDTTIERLPWSIAKLSELRCLSLPKCFRLETLPKHLNDSIIIFVEGRRIRKPWGELKTEIHLCSVPVVGDSPLEAVGESSSHAISNLQIIVHNGGCVIITGLNTNNGPGNQNTGGVNYSDITNSYPPKSEY